MGLMEDPTSGAQLVLTPHPVTLDGQQYLAANLEPGEKLGGFLGRVVPDWSGDCWEVRINGVVVPHEIMDRVRPKENALIEVRGVVKKQVLAIVAIAVLAYFTMGAGLAAYGAAVGVTSAIGLAVLGAVTFAVGSALINKVLMPKPGGSSAATQSDPVYSIGSARNAPRPYDPLPILFGTARITPDVASLPYSWYEGKEQIMGEVFTPGINIHSVEALYNGNTLLSSYEGVTVYTNGLPGHADEDIPLYSNADTIAGGELNADTTWVERGTPLDTVRIQINLEYLLGDSTNKGKPYPNQETVEVQYRVTGEVMWLPLVSRRFVNRNMDTQRATLSADVARGQYDVRVRRLGQSNPEEGHNARAQFQWVTMTAVQADDTDYTGIPRIGVRIQASGQLNGALDEIRCVAHSLPVPVWVGGAWVTEQTSNPGAHLLAYARGIYDANGRLLAGIGLPDTQIDIPALQAFMVHCAANGYTYDAYIKDTRNHGEMCNAIALAGLGQTSWAAGRFGVVWADSAQPLTAVVNMATIKKGSFQVDYTLANASDGIEYTYVDPETWQPVTMRVVAPGVTTMQNPARISGEGITSEAHAAKMARYHLAQHLYQYKDISFSTDLEHLTYRRLSVLALSHDMTQWGHGGRLRAAVDAAGVVTVQLDEPVPSLATPYIGLRIPGEGAYRVFTVEPFVGESDTLTLAESWPVDAAFPGDTSDNPAHDTIWIYDIKATPGYRVRVVQIEPESDLRGARIAVVPESPEFWTYVTTGAYTPPANQSILMTRPVASNLQISESKTVQGDTVFTELKATFDITGTMAYATVHVAQQLDGEWGDLSQVAETRTSEAKFRVPSAGAYRIVVRPYSADGLVGGVATADYLTVGADIPPPAFDAFDVQDLSGGTRKYTWGYGVDTLQAPDFAGAEVRYITGTVVDPVWADMTPVGDDGFHTAAFEAVVPVAGTWTFAARARNTSGELSAALVITRTLTNSLGEVIDGLTTGLEVLEEIGLQNQADIAQEIIDRTTADAAAAIELAVVRAQVGDILEADAWVGTTEYPIGDLVQHDGKLYRSLIDDNLGHTPAGVTDAYWEMLGNYASLGEAVGATAAQVVVNTATIDQQGDDITAVSQTVAQHAARMPAGTDGLATEASVTSVESASVSRDDALGVRATTIESRMPTGTDTLANEARVVTAETTAANATSAVSSALGVVEARMPAGSGSLATQASVSTVNQARVDGDAANAAAITQVSARIGDQPGNAVKKSAFEDGGIGSWSGTVSVAEATYGGVTKALKVQSGSYEAGNYVQVDPGDIFDVEAGVYRGSPTAGQSTSLGLQFLNGDKSSTISQPVAFTVDGASGPSGWAKRSGQITAPAGAVWARPVIFCSITSGAYYAQIKINKRSVADTQNATATQSLTTSVNTLTGKFNAAYTMTLDVNGYVTGFRSENTGNSSSFDIVSDKFRIVSPAGGARTEYSSGNWRVYDAAGVLRVRMGVW